MLRRDNTTERYTAEYFVKAAEETVHDLPDIERNIAMGFANAVAVDAAEHANKMNLDKEFVFLPKVVDEFFAASSDGQSPVVLEAYHSTDMLCSIVVHYEKNGNEKIYKVMFVDALSKNTKKFSGTQVTSQGDIHRDNSMKKKVYKKEPAPKATALDDYNEFKDKTNEINRKIEYILATLLCFSVCCYGIFLATLLICVLLWHLHLVLRGQLWLGPITTETPMSSVEGCVRVMYFTLQIMGFAVIWDAFPKITSKIVLGKTYKRSMSYIVSKTFLSVCELVLGLALVLMPVILPAEKVLPLLKVCRKYT